MACVSLPCAHATFARPEYGGTYLGSSSTARRYIRSADATRPLFQYSSPSWKLAQAASSAFPAASYASRIAASAPGTSPWRSRAYDTRADEERFGLRFTMGW